MPALLQPDLIRGHQLLFRHAAQHRQFLGFGKDLYALLRLRGDALGDVKRLPLIQPDGGGGLDLKLQLSGVAELRLGTKHRQLRFRHGALAAPRQSIFLGKGQTSADKGAAALFLGDAERLGLDHALQHHRALSDRFLPDLADGVHRKHAVNVRLGIRHDHGAGLFPSLLGLQQQGISFIFVLQKLHFRSLLP